MRAARGVLSAFLSMALVVGMVPDCAYAKVAARALHLGASQASPNGAGDVQQASQDDVASSGDACCASPAPLGDAWDVPRCSARAATLAYAQSGTIPTTSAMDRNADRTLLATLIMPLPFTRTTQVVKNPRTFRHHMQDAESRL